MKLEELVGYLTSPEKLLSLYKKFGVKQESEALLIYMKDTLSLDSDIIILEIEETEDDLIYKKNNLKFIQLFSIDQAIDLIEYDLDLKGKGFTEYDIAKQLLAYREKDA